MKHIKLHVYLVLVYDEHDRCWIEKIFSSYSYAIKHVGRKEKFHKSGYEGKRLSYHIIKKVISDTGLSSVFITGKPRESYLLEVM